MRRDWLIEKRNSLELTQESVSEKAKISRAYYAEIEIGSKNPSVKSAQKIATALGFDWTIFFEEECSETRNKAG